MDTKETKSFLSQMQAAYPADLFFEKLKGREAPTIEIWAEALKAVELDCATRFLVGWMKTNTRVPAACDVYQFHKQELIDKRMRIESVQEEFIGDNRNVLLETARKMYEQGLITNPFKKKAQEKTEGEAKQS
jgi:hypothetical protein